MFACSVVWSLVLERMMTLGATDVQQHSTYVYVESVCMGVHNEPV